MSPGRALGGTSVLSAWDAAWDGPRAVPSRAALHNRPTWGPGIRHGCTPLFRRCAAVLFSLSGRYENEQIHGQAFSAPAAPGTLSILTR